MDSILWGHDSHYDYDNDNDDDDDDYADAGLLQSLAASHIYWVASEMLLF